MSVNIGVDGVVRESNNIKVGAGGVVRTVTDGYLSHKGVVRKFLGEPFQISRLEIVPCAFYRSAYDSSVNKWLEFKLFYAADAETAYGSVTISADQVTLKANPSKMVGMLCDIRVRYTNGMAETWDPYVFEFGKNRSFSVSMKYMIATTYNSWTYDLYVFKNRAFQSLPAGVWRTAGPFTSIPSSNKYMITAEIGSRDSAAQTFYLQPLTLQVDNVTYPVVFMES